MATKTAPELQRFLKSDLSYYNAPFELKPLLTKRVAKALAKLQGAVRQNLDFTQLEQLSKEIRLPLSLLERPARQITKKTSNTGPFEIWWEYLYGSRKIGIGNTLEEAFEEAKTLILSTPIK